MPGNEDFSGNGETTPPLTAVIARDISALRTATLRDTMRSSMAEASIQASQTMLRKMSFIMLGSLSQLGVDDAAPLTARLTELETEDPHADLHAIATEYEEKRLRVADPIEQRSAERVGELARAVASTSIATAVWLTRGPLAGQKVLPVARGTIAKVGELEGTEQAVQYLDGLLDQTETIGVPPTQEDETAS